MAGYLRLRRFRAVTLCVCLGLVIGPIHTVRAGGGLAAIDAFHVGRHHLANGERDKALDSFNDAVRMNPQYVQAYVARGKLLAEMGQLDSALADLNFALRLQPTHVEGFAYRGFVLLSQGKPQESLPEFEMALRLDPSYARVHYLHGQALRALGNTTDSDNSIATALRLDPSIEATKVVVTAATDDGSVGVKLNGPGALERSSQMASSEPVLPPRMSMRDQGRVIRVNQHPVLANLSPSFAAPLPAQQPTTVPHSQPIPEPATINTVRQPGPNKVSTLPTESAEELKAGTPAADPTKPANSNEMPEPVPQALAKIEPLPAIEPLPIIQPVPQVLTESVAKAELPAPIAMIVPLPTIESLMQAEPAVKTESSPKIEALPPTEPLAKVEPLPMVETPVKVEPLPSLPTVEPLVSTMPPMENVVAAPAVTPAPEAVAPAAEPVATLAPPVAKPELVPSQAEPQQVVVAEPPMSASAILSGSPLNDPLPPKPTLESSRQRIAAAIAAVQATVAAMPQAMVSDGTPPTTADLTVAAEPSVEALPANPLPTTTAVAVSKAMPEIMADHPVSDAEQIRLDAEMARLRGIENEERGDTTAALAEYDNSVRLDPTNPQTYCLRGRLYLKSNLTLEAAADFERAIQLAPGLAIGYFGRAHTRYVQGDFAAAVEDYNVVLRLDDQHSPALIERGHCLAQLGRGEAAETDRLAALALDPSLAKSGPKYGGGIQRAPAATDIVMPEETPMAFASDAPAQLRQTSGIEPAATSAFGNLFADDHPAARPIPQSTTATITDGVAIASDRNEPVAAVTNTAAEPADVLPSVIVQKPIDAAAAKQELQRLSDELNRTPGDARLYLRRAEALLTLGRGEESLDDLNAALKFDPNLTEAIVVRAAAHMAVQRLPAAESDLTVLLRLYPGDAQLYAERGSVRLALGFAQEAVVDLTQALTLDGDNAAAYCHRGLAWALLGDAERAMSDFTAAIERTPNDAEAYLCRGRANTEFNRFAEALADFNRAIELNPESADAYFERSRLYAARGAYEKSQVDRRRALELDPTLR